MPSFSHSEPKGHRIWRAEGPELGSAPMFSETIILRGHIIDSLILPKVLDQILTQGGEFKIGEIKIGQNRVDQSFARIEVSAPKHELLDDIVLRLRQHGAEVVEKKDVELAPAPADGVFPKDFYVTTNQQTLVTLDGTEIEVHPALMDCAIVVDREARRATAKKFHEILAGWKSSSVIKGSGSCRFSVPQRGRTFSNSCRPIFRSRNRRAGSSAKWRRNFSGPELKAARSSSSPVRRWCTPARCRTWKS